MMVEVQEIEARELKRRIDAAAAGDEGAPLVVDVREPWEHAQYRIEGSLLVPLSEFAERFEELPRDREIVTYCKVGERSACAAAFLMQHGYTRVFNLRGGIYGWSAVADR